MTRSDDVTKHIDEVEEQPELPEGVAGSHLRNSCRSAADAGTHSDFMAKPHCDWRPAFILGLALAALVVQVVQLQQSPSKSVV